MSRDRSIIRNAFEQVARRRTLAVLVCGLLSLTVSAVFTTVRVPTPRVHDEFSYLLAADTFAQGRITNRTHPAWEHLESFHVIQQPSYQSKYQPGQGLILALGTIFGGHPIVGAWIATALAAAAVCWMLQAWVPSRWALLGGMLVALHGMIQVRWALSYWGGSLPMLGGALMFGALPRIWREPRFMTSVAMTVGAVLLAATRPYEGFVVGCCVAVALVIWMGSSRRPDWFTIIHHVILPSVIVLWVGVAVLGYYNWRVTGNPFRLPYQVHEAEYGYSPLFLWKQTGQVPEYRHEVMRDFQTGWAIQDYQQQQSLGGWLAAKAASLSTLGQFFFCGALCVPLLACRQLLSHRKLRFVWLAIVIFFAAEMLVPWTYPHYVAPIAPLLFLLVVQGMRHLATLPRQGHAWARFAMPAVVAVHVVTLVGLLSMYADWQPEGQLLHRARLAEQLENTPGDHLVVVRYGPEHNGHEEWVYNPANIDLAKVVWVRSMGPEVDARLFRYFDYRKIWVVDADVPEPRLMDYRSDTTSGALSAAVSAAPTPEL